MPRIVDDEDDEPAGARSKKPSARVIGSDAEEDSEDEESEEKGSGDEDSEGERSSFTAVSSLFWVVIQLHFTPPNVPPKRTRTPRSTPKGTLKMQ